VKGDRKTVYQLYFEAFPDAKPILAVFAEDGFALDQALELAVQRGRELSTDERKSLGLSEDYPVPGLDY
jgi:hypothetical protein